MKHRILSLTLLALAALLLSACNIQIVTNIAEDGSGAYGLEMGMTQEEQQLLVDSGSSPEEFCAEIDESGEGVPEGATVTSEQRGDDLYCIMVSPFADLGELRQLYGEGEGITVNSLEIANGELIYDLDVDLSGEDTGNLGATEIEFTWRVTVPGVVGQHNADTAEGNTLTWSLSPGEARNIHVESSVGGAGLPGGGTLWAVVGLLCSCLCGLVLLAAIGGGIFYFTRRSKAAPPAPPPPPSEPPTIIQP